MDQTMAASSFQSHEQPFTSAVCSPSGPFASAAFALANHGLAVIPVGGTDGKKPLVTWAKLRKPFCAGTLRKMAAKHGGANIGVLCGLSKVSVVDIDDPTLTEDMIDRFGATPLITETPSGGVHLWYRSNDERSTTLRAEGLAVDIKAAGGFVVVPPSVRPNGPHAGKRYKLIRGSWDDLRNLPQMSSNNVMRYRKAAGVANVNRLRTVSEGRRNDFLFRTLLREVQGCEDLPGLLVVAQRINEDFCPPLSNEEVHKTAASVWDLHVSGQNWAGNSARAVISATELEFLRRHPDALALICVLKAAHGGRQQPFAVSPKSMANSRYIGDWGPKRYKVARDWLLEVKMLLMVHKGGSGPRDPSLFTLPRKLGRKGLGSAPNITKHLPPLPPVPLTARTQSAKS